jgi:hypothetical protein
MVIYQMGNVKGVLIAKYFYLNEMKKNKLIKSSYA